LAPGPIEVFDALLGAPGPALSAVRSIGALPVIAERSRQEKRRGYSPLFGDVCLDDGRY
jgi:hypothetical protein